MRTTVCVPEAPDLVALGHGDQANATKIVVTNSKIINVTILHVSTGTSVTTVQVPIMVTRNTWVAGVGEVRLLYILRPL